MRNELADMLERALWTAVQTATSVLVVGSMLDLSASTLEVAALTAGASALSVIKTYAATRLGALGTATAATKSK